MLNVLVGFKDDKLLKRIGKLVNTNSFEDLKFTIKTTKATVLSEIDTDEYDVALLREDCGYEEWDTEEILALKDTHDIKIVLLVSDKLRGDSDMSDFLSVGLTSAVFMRGGGVYKVDEIVHMIYGDRTTSEAREYYGISKLADNSQAKALDKIAFEDARKTLLGMPDELLGPKFYDIALGFSMAQTCDFIQDYLDEDLKERLQDTLEYYDVLELLKRGDKDHPGVIEKYHIPKEIKKRQREREKERRRNRVIEHKANKAQDEVVEDIEREEDVVFVNRKEKVIDAPSYEINEVEDDEDEQIDKYLQDIEESDSYEFSDSDDGSDIEAEDDYTFGDSAAEETGSIPEEDTISFDDSEGEFSFSAAGAAVDKESSETVSDTEPEDTEMKKEKLKEKIKKSSKGEKKDRTIPRDGGTPRVKHLTIDDVEEKKDSTEDKKNAEKEKKAIVTAILVFLIVMFFIALIVILFIKITIDRKNKQMQPDTSAYDTQYNPEDVAKYELTENGTPMLYDEEGNLLYDGTDQNNSMPEVVTPDEEMDFMVVNEPEELPDDVVRQEFNDVSGFTNGSIYKGLDLVNLINGNSGANCTLQMKNGSTVDIERGRASIEDFKPSGKYLCETDGTSLTFIEQ